MGYQPGQPPFQPDQPNPHQQGYQGQPPYQPQHTYQQSGYQQQPFQQSGYQQPPFQQPGYPQPPFQQPGYQESKDWLIALLLCVFVGGLGVHRFYTGKIATGIIMLCTGGGCGIWWIIDIILIATGSFTDSNGMPLVKR